MDMSILGMGHVQRKFDRLFLKYYCKKNCKHPLSKSALHYLQGVCYLRQFREHMYHSYLVRMMLIGNVTGKKGLSELIDKGYLEMRVIANKFRSYYITDKGEELIGLYNKLFKEYNRVCELFFWVVYDNKNSYVGYKHKQIINGWFLPPFSSRDPRWFDIDKWIEDNMDKVK